MPEPHAAEPDRTVPRAERFFHGVVAAVLVAMVAGSVWPVDVSTLPDTFSVPHDEGTICMLRRVTGMPCPTCGATRSLRALGQGQVAAAVRFHPLGPLYGILLLVVMVRSAGIALSGRTWLERTARVLVWMLPFLALATVGLYVVRMWLFFADGTGSAAWAASPMGRLLAVLG
ncbi:MAG: DUF2752 domain-containing protein [Planctomycetota bacterium]|nr:DUF2752 domain-containing protein [Planctomycetota bacterium]